ncbi:glycosyltransferase [Telluribacter humicola]|uniref:glycosyltransferase n=1 Tax=Telluribacter humicola TaxID=1720261 RepID=UPI001A959067|nr:glycosyltransferase [Telluribacter humicola]
MERSTISVCIATYNGGNYILDQLSSILPQLDVDDEIIISDDSSIDNTVFLADSLKDKRIKIFKNNKFRSPIFNFEHAITRASGNLIFLCDQDDIWLPNKVSTFLEFFERTNADLLVSNCSIVDKDLSITHLSYFDYYKISGKERFIHSFLSNPYLGCCLAFKRIVLRKILPFPAYIPMHDIWIGMICAIYYKVEFIQDVTMLYRRHESNATPYTATQKSKNSLLTKIHFRLNMLRGLLLTIVR